MNKSFLYKYQPNKFEDFETKKELIHILKSLIIMDNLNILLIGSAGSGKTTLIKAIIKEYYNTDTIPENNILYINNLTDQGIQYYRSEVKTFCQINSSFHNKKKFIILDDIDIINDQSQQVFRNCIDKYSHNVHFIASCVNPQKVIDSIQSRNIVLKIKTIEKFELKQILKKILTLEKINIDNETIEFLLIMSNNSIRLLINYIEKFKILNCKITLNIAKKICTNISYYEFEKYTYSLLNDNNLEKAIDIFTNIYKKGYSVGDILDSYFKFIKVTKIISEINKYNIIKLICKYITIFHTIHEDVIELILFTNDLKKTLE